MAQGEAKTARFSEHTAGPESELFTDYCIHPDCDRVIKESTRSIRAFNLK